MRPRCLDWPSRRYMDDPREMDSAVPMPPPIVHIPCEPPRRVYWPDIALAIVFVLAIGAAFFPVPA